MLEAWHRCLRAGLRDDGFSAWLGCLDGAPPSPRPAQPSPGSDDEREAVRGREHAPDDKRPSSPSVRASGRTRRSCVCVSCPGMGRVSLPATTRRSHACAGEWGGGGGGRDAPSPPAAARRRLDGSAWRHGSRSTGACVMRAICRAFGSRPRRSPREGSMCACTMCPVKVCTWVGTSIRVRICARMAMGSVARVAAAACASHCNWPAAASSVCRLDGGRISLAGAAGASPGKPWPRR